jgi:lipopolysaccharide transport system ATP-binding protein
MSAVIRVENLSKRYRIGQKAGAANDSLVMAAWNALRAPFLNYRKIRSLTQFEAPDDTTFWALKDVSFEVQPGEVLGVIGHNGAGKSTLLKILSRITEPTTGEIIIKGRVSALLEVGTGFHPDLTGRENVYMNGTILGMTKKEIDRKFDEIVDFSRIEQYIDTPVKFYSSGMKVRLGFAVAAHLEPEILIVDEVLAVGDIGFQRKCLGKMNEVSKSGRTILFVSHNMAAVQALCTHGILLHHGKVRHQGVVAETIRHYLAEFQSVDGDFLSGNIDRQGSGKARIVSFEIRNLKNEPIESTCSGADIALCFQVKNETGKPLKDIDLGFSIHHTEDDSLATILYSSYMGKVFDLTDQELTIQCSIRNLPLPGGKYLVKAQVMQQGEVLDFPARGVGYLEIFDGDFYGTGIKSTRLSRSKPDFLITGNWEQLWQ